MNPSYRLLGHSTVLFGVMCLYFLVLQPKRALLQAWVIVWIICAFQCVCVCVCVFFKTIVTGVLVKAEHPAISLLLHGSWLNVEAVA